MRKALGFFLAVACGLAIATSTCPASAERLKREGKAIAERSVG